MPESKIKNLRPLTRSQGGKYSQGYFNPINPTKYVGKEKVIIYRSSWEKRFMIFCDTQEKVLEWNSESIEIEYYNPIERKTAKYYPDFYVRMKDSTGESRLIIEVKPKNQLEKPKAPIKMTPKTLKSFRTSVILYIVNQAKFEAASKYAMNREMKFVVITEEQLFSTFK